MGCRSPGWPGQTAVPPRQWPSDCLPTPRHWPPTLALVLQSCCCGQARLLRLCPHPSFSWPMVADVPRPWDQNRALGPPAPQGPHPAGTGRESESLEEMQQCSMVGYACGHKGRLSKQGWEADQRRKLRENSEERKAGKAALGACNETEVTWQGDCFSYPELRPDTSAGISLLNR